MTLGYIVQLLHKALIIIFPASFSSKDKVEIHFEKRGIYHLRWLKNPYGYLR